MTGRMTQPAGRTEDTRMTEDAVRRPVVPEAAPAPGAEDGFDAHALRAETATRFTAAVAAIDAGELDFPLPGSGGTAERFAALRAVAEDDLCLARLVEGHVDATAVLAELGGPAPEPGRRWGCGRPSRPARGCPPSGAPTGGGA